MQKDISVLDTRLEKDRDYLMKRQDSNIERMFIYFEKYFE